jgi:hypothetical protein
MSMNKSIALFGPIAGSLFKVLRDEKEVVISPPRPALFQDSPRTAPGGFTMHLFGATSTVVYDE